MCDPNKDTTMLTGYTRQIAPVAAINPILSFTAWRLRLQAKGLPLKAPERQVFTKWLEELQEKITDCWVWHSPAVQIGFRYAEPDQGDEFWEIWAYPAVQEIVGGKEDGEMAWSGFKFDVLEFLTDFEPEAVSLRAPGAVTSPACLADSRNKSVAGQVLVRIPSAGLQLHQLPTEFHVLRRQSECGVGGNMNVVKTLILTIATIAIMHR
jgi:hypothetical protein